MDRIIHKRTLEIARDKAEFYKKLLASDDVGEEKVYFETVDFGNGIEVDIKICGSDDGTPWTEAIMFKNGSEVCCTEVGDEFFGEWELEYNGEEYVVEVVERKEIETRKWYCSVIRDVNGIYSADLCVNGRFVSGIYTWSSYKDLRNDIKSKTGIEIPKRNQMIFEEFRGKKYALIDASQVRSDCRVTLEERINGWFPGFRVFPKQLVAYDIFWDTDGEDVKLPEEITLPAGMTDEEDVSDYLSDYTGFCVLGFSLMRSKTPEETIKDLRNLVAEGAELELNYYPASECWFAMNYYSERGETTDIYDENGDSISVFKGVPYENVVEVLNTMDVYYVGK